MPDTEKPEAYRNSMKKMKTNHPLRLMINGKLTDHSCEGIYQQLLDHPLALVSRKWNHIGWKFHAVNVLLYSIYLVVFTVCVSTTVPPYMHSQNQSNVTTYGNATTDPNLTISPAETTCQNTTTCLNKTTLRNPETKVACNSFKSNRKSTTVDVQYLVIGLSVIMILKEVYQLVRMYGCEYFKQKENYVELAVYISFILFVINFTDCENTDYRTTWQWYFGTFSVLLAWTNLLTYARKTCYLGTYVLMLLRISKTFLTRVFPMVAVLLIALGTAFYCVLQNQDEFGNFWHSILATSSFLVGGFEYGEFQGFVDNNDLAPVGYIVYILFLFITIIVLNLMIGEAVENVEKIHKRACDTRFALQIKYVLEFEGIICFVSSKLKTHCGIFKLKKWFILNPNETIRLKDLKSRGLQDLIDKTKSTEGQDGLHEKMNTIDMTGEITTIKDEILNVKEILRLQSKEMTNTNKRMNKIETELSTIKDDVLSIKEMLRLLSKDLANTNKTSTDLN
ncbi:transient receptor potential cation channel subfamily A member 1 homolog isoform X2 [Mercenaria mercenaria]|uniref:transient receptor potential cation channel subfamily A member 1 homolog isoform X2 n=1 Tax=Mercenaria mercenaria TaxID=6596 RepID=UPI00234E5DEE|nr:transient receptor potential cation channel subfamily A member 1 homolog isoform X2 [Mercenaria mercenaria]